MPVLYEERDALALVRLARPAQRNALTRETLTRLREIFDRLARRPDLRAVVLGGEGADFCAGDDAAELQSLDAEGARLRAELLRAVCERIESCGLPVVLALGGNAAGAGYDLALACHLRVASDDARLTPPTAPPEAMTPPEALRRGLVNRVVPPAAVFAEAEALARAVIATGAPLAARACLEAVTRGARLPLAEALALEAELFARLFSTADAREGLRAFLEKRAPDFKGW